MNNYCAFSIDHKCIKWIDYEIPRQELVEADELCHGNWIEIEKKNKYIHTLQTILESNHISPRNVKQLNKGSDIYARPSNEPLKPDPHDKPSNRLENAQKL